MTEYTNSEISKAIDEYIHNVKYREVLKDRLIDGLTHAEIADKRHFSERQIRNILYKNEEKIFKHLTWGEKSV